MEKLKIGTLFPNTNESIAFYSPTAFCITLRQITARQLSEIKPGFDDAIDKRRVLYHEMRHNIDHLSTLWGQNRIKNLFDAINSRLSLDEYQFYKIINYKIEEKQFHFDTYYTEQYNQVSYNTPYDRWICNLSTGIRFNHLGEPNKDVPILFINFGTQEGIKINRIPISIASLLETNAIYEETVVERNFLDTLVSPRKEKEAIALDKAFFKSIIYEQNLAVYNSAVHLAANILGLSNIHTAFDIASSIATVVLNIPEEFIENIPIDTEYMAIWNDRPRNLLSNYDYGFLYYNMLVNYKEKYIKNGVFDIEEFLDVNKLPNKSKLEYYVIEKFNQLNESYSNDKHFFEFFQQQSKCGLDLLNLRGIDGKGCSLKKVLLSGCYTPFIVTRDDTFYQKIKISDITNGPIMKNININEWYHLANEINNKMEEFFLIRGL